MANSPTQAHYAGSKPVWDKARPKKAGKVQKLSDVQKERAKRAAAKAGRPYPNLVDNMNAAKRG
jgi:hypothetical protein